MEVTRAKETLNKVDGLFKKISEDAQKVFDGYGKPSDNKKSLAAQNSLQSRPNKVDYDNVVHKIKYVDPLDTKQFQNLIRDGGFKLPDPVEGELKIASDLLMSKFRGMENKDRQNLARILDAQAKELGL